MSNKKDIFDLFREGESRLRERPPAQAWDRLEHRLDKRRASGGSTLYRRLAMAATLLLLIGLTAILPMYLSPKGDTGATASGEATFLLSEINSGSDDLPSYRPLAINTTYANVRLNEGDRAKRLTVAMHNTERLNQPPSTGEAQSPQLAQRDSESSAPATIVPDQPEETIRLQDEVVAIPENYSAEMEIAADDAQVDGYGPPAEPEPMPQYEEEGLAEMDMEQVPTQSERKAKATDEITQMNARSNAIYFTADELDPQVRQFQWLIGQWETTQGIGSSTETWQVEDEFTITGQGRLNLNGEEIFTEQMEIRKIGEQLYFITATEESGEKRYFRLRSYENGTAVFANATESGSPRQLIIQQLDANNFMTTFTEDESEAIPPEQQNYLQYRNAVEPDRASRNLSRVNGN